MNKFSFECIDGHTCGNPVRLITKGHPDLKSISIAEKRIEFQKEFDWIRTSLMYEPRGHDMMSGSFIYPPSDPKNDLAILFIETSGCLPMCGHGTIGTITFGIEEGLIEVPESGILKVEVPAGLIEVGVFIKGKKVESVSINNVPSFLYQSNLAIKSEYLGEVKLDISYGGNFYGIIEPQGKYQGLESQNAMDLIRFSGEIREKVNQRIKIIHPQDDRIRGLSHILWADPPKGDRTHHRNAVFYGENAIDRSPCGTGTSARMAQLYHRGELGQGEDFIHESIIGSQFTGRIKGTSDVGSFKGILPEISGWARITGYNKIIIDPDDPFWKGFQVK